MTEFHIENMECGGCVRGVTRAIYRIDPEAQVEADPPSRRVRVQSGLSGAAFLPALEAAGFPAEITKGS